MTSTPHPLTRGQGPARVAFVIFAIMASLPLVKRLLWAANVPAVSRLIGNLEGLVTTVGAIFFLVWLHRTTKDLRAAGQSTRYSPGMAVGGWFIPFANFALPYLSMRDVWRRAMGDEQGFLVPLWWTTYLMAIAFKVIWAVPALGRNMPGAVGYLSSAITIAAYGSWALMMFQASQPREQGELAAV